MNYRKIPIRNYLYTMKYEVGDTVLLLHSNEEGKVVEIMNENMVMVNVEGVEFPVFMDQIDFPYFKRFSEQSKRDKEKLKDQKLYIDQIPKERKPSIEKKIDNGVYFSFVPVYDTTLYEDNIEHFKLYLLNQNNEPYYFEYSVQYKFDSDFVITNTINSQNDFYLHNIAQEELNDITKFQFHFSLIHPDKNRTEKVEKTLKIKAKSLFHKIEEMHSRNEPSFTFELFNKYPDKTVEEYFPLPEKISSNPLLNTALEGARSVIDIHIEKIINEYEGLSNFEILQIQLSHFEKYYQLSIAHMQPKLIVIHGVGSGKLRDEIHQRLRTKKEVSTFINQYHPNFGFGATEIFFQY